MILGLTWHGARPRGATRAHIHERENKEMNWLRIAMALMLGLLTSGAVAGTKTNTAVYVVPTSGYA